MKPMLLLSAGFVLAANMALAAVTPEALAAAYEAKGFTHVHVTAGPTQIKVEAVRNHAQVEAVYDAQTGAMLKQEKSRASRDAERAETEATEIEATDHDFLDDKGKHLDDVNDDAKDDAGDDNGTGSENENEHESGDHGGSDGGSDGGGHDGGGKGGAED